MDKPFDGDIAKALDQRAKFRTASPVLAEAFDTMNQYRHWADAELELAAKQEKHLSLQLIEAHADRDRGTAAKREFGHRLDLKDAKIVELRRDIKRLETNLVVACQREITKGAEVAAYRRENESFRAENVSKAAKIIDLQETLVSAENLRYDANKKCVELTKERDRARAARDQAVNLQEALVADLSKEQRQNNRLLAKVCDSCGKASSRIDQLRTAEEQQVQLDEMIATLNANATPKGKSYADAELGVIQECLNALERIPAAQRSAVTQYLTSRAHSAAWGAMPQPVPPPW